MNDNKHYRYCFSCNQWKSKEEVNEINLGGNNKTFNCNICRKDLGENIQIVRCPNHQEIILKIWGTCEGQNKEKIFFKECPKESQQEERPKPETIGKRALWWIGGGVILIGGLVWIIYWFFSKKGE